MKTLRIIILSARAVYRLVMGLCPECGGKLGDTDEMMSIEYEYCECCHNGNVQTRREVFRRFMIRG